MKDHAALVAWLDRHHTVPYESPTRGAVCIARLSYGLPASEAVPVLRTIRHPHRVQRWVDQYGDGEEVPLRTFDADGHGR